MKSVISNENNESKFTPTIQVHTPAKRRKKNKNKETLKKYDARGVQTLFRTMSRNHYSLLQMVDNESRIILTINSIVVSILMWVLFVVPESDKLILETGTKILINFSVLSMVLALFGMLPHKYIGQLFKRSEYKGSLYAGNYTNLSLEEFQLEFARIMDNGQSLYDEMIKDLYFLGVAIARKQRLLVYSVAVFLVGLVVSVVYSTMQGFMLF